MIKRFFSIKNKSGVDLDTPRLDAQPPCAPENTCLYAIGDIHGRADLLTQLLQKIERDARDLTPGTKKVLIFLGDYIDRGAQSREVLDILMRGPLPGFESYFLKGNHEEMLLYFLGDSTYGITWCDYGGLQTLESYGAAASTLARHPMAYDHAAHVLRTLLPPEHLDFLNELEPSLTLGDYFFVHAGVRPGVALDDQQEKDMLWIRDSFLHSKKDFSKIVVHGHTPEIAVQARKNRIGIDTGAFMTDVLTCLVLEGNTRRLLQTDTLQPASAPEA